MLLYYFSFKYSLKKFNNIILCLNILYKYLNILLKNFCKSFPIFFYLNHILLYIMSLLILLYMIFLYNFKHLWFKKILIKIIRTND